MMMTLLLLSSCATTGAPCDVNCAVCVVICAKEPQVGKPSE